jgi:hypothetical protein
MFVFGGELDFAWDIGYIEWLNQFTLHVPLFPPRGLCNKVTSIPEQMCLASSAIAR